MGKPCSECSDCRRRGCGRSRATLGFSLGKRKVEDADNLNAKVLASILRLFRASKTLDPPLLSLSADAIQWSPRVLRPVFQWLVLPLNAAKLSFEAVVAKRMYFLTRKIYSGTYAALGGSLETSVAPEDIVVERDRVKD